MSAPICMRCGQRPATLLGVPAEAQVFERPDGSPITNGMSFRVESGSWLRLCGTCAEAAMTTREIIATFDLATWRDPQPPAESNTLDDGEQSIQA